MKDTLLNLLKIVCLPLVLIGAIFRSDRSVVKKLGLLLLAIAVFGLLWLALIGEIVSTAEYGLFETGVSDKLTKVTVRGTSMLPTIQDGSTVELVSPHKFGLKRGDIVSFNNQETGSLYYIKRIIGLPEEKVTIKNGYVLINDRILDEGYTFNRQPTFGNTFLLDCESQVVPKDHYLVMGDNRFVSSDSRVIGFVHKDDIEGVIKTGTEERFLSNQVQDKILRKTIEPERFLQLINDQRDKKGLSQLVTHERLNRLAVFRAEQVKQDVEEWKKQIIPIEKVLQSNGYGYNLAHEYVTFGYLDEKAVAEQIFELPYHKDAFLSSKYTEVGIGVTEKTNGECSYPVISVILSWPSKPTYEQSIIDEWEEGAVVTEKVLAGAKRMLGSRAVDQEKLRTLIDKAAMINEVASRIHGKMKAGEWLNEKDNRDIKDYDSNLNEVNTLYLELSGKKVQGVSVDWSDPGRL